MLIIEASVIAGTEQGITYTMTSDTGFYREIEARCIFSDTAETPEECYEINPNDYAWQHCTIQYWTLIPE